MKQILVGSRAFFSGIEGFRSNDTNFLVLVENPTDFQWRREQTLRGISMFHYRQETPARMVQRTLDNGNPLLAGKFLVPEVAQAIDATVDDILPLEPLFAGLDDRHRYEAVIFNAYKQNGTFTLTEQQLQDAYASYCNARKTDGQQRDHETASANFG